MANNIDLIGDQAVINQLTNGDFSETNYKFEDNVLTKIDRAYGFSHFSNLKTIIIKNAVIYRVYTFANNTNLRLIDLHSFNRGDAGAQEEFINDWSLYAVAIRKSTAVSPIYTTSFNNTHFAGNRHDDGIFVYVPRNMIDSYKIATNWSAYYAAHPNIFRALEDYTVDGTITGDIDESKIFIPSVPVYSIENRVLNGSSDYIDTGVSLFDSDNFAFTIFIDFTMNADYSGRVSDSTILHCRDESTTNGFVFRRCSNNQNDEVIYYPQGASALKSVNNIKLSSGNRYRISFSTGNHSYSNLCLYAFGRTLNSSLVSSELTVTGTLSSMDNTLVIGATKKSDGTYEKFTPMTIHSLKIYKTYIPEWERGGFVYNF